MQKKHKASCSGPYQVLHSGHWGCSPLFLASLKGGLCFPGSCLPSPDSYGYKNCPSPICLLVARAISLSDLVRSHITGFTKRTHPLPHFFWKRILRTLIEVRSVGPCSQRAVNKSCSRSLFPGFQFILKSLKPANLLNTKALST